MDRRPCTTPGAALFDKIAAAIEEQPHLYDQRFWAMEQEDEVSCGTAHCIAGWAVFLEDGVHCDEDGYVKVEDRTLKARGRAAELLGLEDREDEWEASEAQLLFHENWMHGRPVEDVADALRNIGRGASIPDGGVWGI